VGRINWGRVIGGGLLAGLVMMLLEFLCSIAMRAQWEKSMSAEQMAAAQKPTAMAAHLVWSFVIGILAVWLYAAIRPRFGPGPKTAIIAGLVVGLLTHVTISLAFGTLDMAPDNLMAISAVWGIVASVAGALAGGWIYKET
jgi:hypothetical protein